MNRSLRFAVAALGLSVLGRLGWLLTPDGLNLVDLRVYVYGSANLAGGHLYDFTYSDKTPDFPLPFTYPPFAALIFYPLHVLPFAVVAFGWVLLTVAALYAVVRMSLAMLLGADAGEPHRRTTAIAWTAIGMWMEPVRTTLDYGQVNVFLVLASMVAATSTIWWLSGLLIGAAAGVKLTPAITGLYLLTQRRWASAVFAVGVFAATIGLCAAIVPGQTRTYFGPLVGDADRIGPVGSVWNQSLRGALTRLLGHDAGAPWYLAGHRIPFGPWWSAAVVVTAILAVWAARSLPAGDTLGVLLVVQLFGLMVSPISWSHHWVWLLPVILWLRYGPFRERLGARLLALCWMITTLAGVPWLLAFFQPTIWTISRPSVLAWLGTVDVAGVLVLFVWLIAVGRRPISPVAPGDLSREPVPHPAA